MGLDTKITRKLDNNYVQVDVTSKKTNPRYFKVPAAQADEFCKSYKKQQRQFNIWSNLAFGASIVTGCILVSLLTRKMKKGAAIALGILGGIGGAIASTIGFANIAVNQQDKLFKSFNAEELDFNNKRLPV